MSPAGFEPTPRHATPRHDQWNSAFDRSTMFVRYQVGVFIVLQYPDIWIQMDMWKCMYGIGYALITNAKFCKKLLY